jgi:signal transduction histidine kinase
VFGCGESESGLMTLKFKLPYFQNAFIDDLLRERRKSTVGYFSKVYTEEEKNLYYKYALNNTELQHLPDDIKQQIHNSKAYGLSTAFARLSMIMVNDMEGNILDEGQAEIVQRFSTVFEQAYIRFLDLQKAEAQAREAEIEAALERLRAASMAMRHSEELTATASVMFEELVKLGLKPWSFAFVIFRDTTDVADCWSSDQLGASATLVLPHKPDPFLKKSYHDWKNKESLTVMEAKGAALRKHQQYMKSIPEFEKILKKRRSAGIKVLDKMIFHKAHFRYGYIMINTSEPQPEYWEIFKRFSKVFEQTYTRFLDLQKAEAQAREAQIEASLERVRARTMAMHKSDELTDTATELYKQLMTLGLQPWNFAFIIFRDNSDVAECWSSDQTGALPKIVLPHKPEKFLNKTFEEWKKGESLTITHAKGAALKKHQVYMKSISGFDQIVEQRKKAGLDLPKQMIFHNAHFEYGYLMINTLEPQPEYLDIFKRFAKVFEQTYTRFLDLKNAEEQAAITEKQNRELAQSYKDLQETQAQLVQAEKMASLGELTAGIAHEIQNPLNFVNNFSEVSNELLEEMEEELDQGNMEDVREIINDLKQNLGKIHHHGGRADSIVKGMLQHSRTSSGEKEPTDINELADEYLRLAYHGLRAKYPNFNAAMETHFNTSIGKIKVIPQDIGRVLLNLITNAFQAVHEKTMSMSEGTPSLDPVPERREGAGGKGGNVSDNSQRAPSIPEGTTSHSASYKPKITLSTLRLHDSSTLQITIQDNGPGIPDSIKDKIFQPFFTTKPTGQGTGLGLSLAYDIVKAHGGEIMVESAKDKGTTFTVELPIV